MDIISRIIDDFCDAFAIPPEEAKAIEKKYRQQEGGDSHYIASLRSMEVAERHDEVKRLIGQGLTDAQIAERMGMARGHAWRLRQRLSLDMP